MPGCSWTAHAVGAPIIAPDLADERSDSADSMSTTRDQAVLDREEHRDRRLYRQELAVAPGLRVQRAACLHPARARRHDVVEHAQAVGVALGDHGGDQA